ncbi:MAG: NUDIX domain-containing protein [Oscillospiraceae bacterium]|nr:NUDIX domain-containing protein [Oscillospiraceae bacterium]
MKREKSCGGVVYKMENGVPHFVLIKHRKGGHWAFPKGHMEQGESERETARREIREETGVTGKFIKGFRRSVSYIIRGTIHKEVVYFLYEISPDSVIVKQEEEIGEAEFVPESEVMAKLTYENDKITFSRALEKIKSKKG